MKKIIALILCGVMLLTLAVGCKKEEQPEELIDARIAHDLTNSTHLYPYTHIVGTPDIKDLQVVSRNESGNRTIVSVDANLYFSNADLDLKADMEYLLIGNHWKLEDVKVTHRAITVTGAPHQASVMSDLTNYIGIVGSAYSVMDDTYQPLYFNINDPTVEMQYESGAKTAALKLAYTSDKLTFEGTYTLTFDEESGWHFETVKQADGRQHPLLRLTKLEQKK